MKRNIKSIIAVVLAVVMLLSTAAVAATAAEKVTPVIVVSGLNSFPLFDKDENQVFAPTAESIIKVVGKSMLPLAKAVVKGDWSVFGDGCFKAVQEGLFEVISCDEKGDSIRDDIHTVVFPESIDNYPQYIAENELNDDEVAIMKALTDRIGGENVYFFNYDWRLDPMCHVDPLKEMIEKVKAEKNADEVILVPCSMGGIVVNSYLSKYGSDGISKILYCTVASKGLDLVGELFSKEVKVDVNTLMEYFFSFEAKETFAQALIGVLQTSLEVTPKITKMIDKFIEKSLDELNEQAFNEIFLKSFALMPGIWSFCPDEYYESDKKAIFPNGENKELIERLDAYHYNVQVKAEDLIKQAMDNGCEVYIIAGYGYVGFPATKAAFTQSDCLIETKNEAFGATTARYGEAFAKDYKAAGTVCNDPSHNHVSTDGAIDASTGAFPEITWFIKNNRHVGFSYNTDASEMLMWMILNDKPVDIYTNEKYPQFVELNLVSGKFSSLTGSEIKASYLDVNSNAISRLIRFVINVYTLIKSALSK